MIYVTKVLPGLSDVMCDTVIDISIGLLVPFFFLVSSKTFLSINCNFLHLKKVILMYTVGTVDFLCKGIMWVCDDTSQCRHVFGICILHFSV